MTTHELDALARIVNHYLADERKDYVANPREGHIFLDLAIARNLVAEEAAKDTTI